MFDQIGVAEPTNLVFFSVLKREKKEKREMRKERAAKEQNRTNTDGLVIRLEFF
jgi:hypothetical protein